MTLGEKIKKYRKEKGWSQRKLSEISGVSHTQIANYETNTTIPTLETIKRIAIGLDINYVLLLDNNLEMEAFSNDTTEYIKADLELSNDHLKQRQIFNIVSNLRRLNIGYETEYRTDVTNGKLVFNHNDKDDDPMEDPAKIYTIPVTDQELIELEKQTDDYFKLKLQELVVNKKGGFLFFFDLDKDQDK